jgi:uncharacterized protein
MGVSFDRFFAWPGMTAFAAVTYLLAASSVGAQQFPFPAAAVGDSAKLSIAMPQLAKAVIAVYRDDDPRAFLDNLFRLQLVAGRYADADRSIESLRILEDTSDSPQARATNAQYQVFAQAMRSARPPARPSAESFRKSFRGVIRPLDDRASALVMRALAVDLPPLHQSVTGALPQQKDKQTIALPDALRLIRAYQIEQAYRSLLPFVPPLIAEDDRRRYTIDRDIPVKTPDGATVCAMIVRPRSATGRMPALLNFTIYANPVTLLNEARRSASNGYAGVEGLTRGKGCSPDQPVPYEHDGSDAAALIDWISEQEWSDGRVGMYGGSYEGFTQWAAAKHRPRALKAMMTSVTAAPGIDVPMDGNVFLTFTYPWTFYTTNSKTLDSETYNDYPRWNRLNQDLYAKGFSYRQLEKVDGTPNPVFDRWLAHPSYDSYWQSMIPYRQDFSRIDIPVLTTTGYYDPGQRGALYYFTEHQRHNPAAEHYLLIGPYDHVTGQRGTIGPLGNNRNVVLGYQMDPMATIDLGELRYQWFDHVLKGSPGPALLKDKVNYQVMGANEWKHAPSVAAMGRMQRFHLSPERSGDGYRLSDQKPEGDSAITQTLDLADRSDANRVPTSSGNIADKRLDSWNGLVFVSDPFSGPTELSGLFSGRLDFASNKKDFDFQVSLYQLTPEGDYFQLSYYWSRASFVRDLSQRQLLTPGRREQLDFKSGRLTSRRFEPGSRLVVVLSLLKQPGVQINYGTGKDVSDETIADAGAPLQIRWLSGTFFDLPTRR